MKPPGRRVTVEWCDATDQTEIKLDDVLTKNPLDYCKKRLSVGWLVTETPNAIVLVTDIDDDKLCDITAIPKKWVVKVN